MFQVQIAEGNSLNKSNGSATLSLSALSSSNALRSEANKLSHLRRLTTTSDIADCISDCNPCTYPCQKIPSLYYSLPKGCSLPLIGS